MIAFPQPAQTENALLVPLLPCRILSKLLKELHQANSSFPPSAEGDPLVSAAIAGHMTEAVAGMTVRAREPLPLPQNKNGGAVPVFGGRGGVM